MLIETLRHEHVGPEVHGPPPELGQQLALDLNVLNVLGVLGLADRRHDLIELDRDTRRLAWIDAQRAGRAVEVARSTVPMLSLAAVHRELHGLAVLQVERFVLVKHCLDVVLTGLKRGEALVREAEDVGIDHGLGPGPEAVDVDPEDLRRVDACGHLESRLRSFACRDDEQDATIQRLRAHGLVEGDAELQRRVGRGRLVACEQERYQGRQIAD